MMCGTAHVNGKREVIRYLQLEKKAVQWYGQLVCRAHFIYTVVQDMHNFLKYNNGRGKDKTQAVNERIKHAIDGITQESHILEKALYSLSEQQGGVPRIFLNATAKCDSKGVLSSFFNQLEDYNISNNVDNRNKSSGFDDVIVMDVKIGEKKRIEKIGANSNAAEGVQKTFSPRSGKTNLMKHMREESPE
eukprot:CAMPEP_0195513042 /NCGR_PEP_ID=MMETSP0794_2-20130614/4802_1 /TAXON_ID=515487 /ORGANISM="Stephanopyxis turris, Strain CCMP 815" /LENGTH=189 /DNA_ID=CAMNT_0040640961 /DNA_START=26 /DNA_END=592 /DNA_ORIENTATION=+